jgi:hypothetical protein
MDHPGRFWNVERPYAFHIIKRATQGGVPGEVHTLRDELGPAFSAVQDDLDTLVTLQDEGHTILIGGKTKINFVGSAVVAVIDPLDPRKVDVIIEGAHPISAGSIQRTFTHDDYPLIEIGTVSAGITVEKVVVEVGTPFDENVGFQVGDDFLQSRFMDVADTSPQYSAMYLTYDTTFYVVDTLLKLYFLGPLPTMGSGRVIIYFS